MKILIIVFVIIAFNKAASKKRHLVKAFPRNPENTPFSECECLHEGLRVSGKKYLLVTCITSCKVKALKTPMSLPMQPKMPDPLPLTFIMPSKKGKKVIHNFSKLGTY